MHEDHLSKCIELAYRGQGRVSPNPLVGCVVLNSEGAIVGEGFHQKYGEAHAEVNALERAGERARGGTLYVNLEPCCHFGKTAPCVDRIIAAGVKRVVAGIVDPDARVSGRGFAKLEGAGIEVLKGMLAADCAWINRGFIKRAQANLPWVCLKLATTIDGKIADREGKSRWLTGEQSRNFVHKLRSQSDCVIIGGATAAVDDPFLNVRGIEGTVDPLKVVIDGKADLRPDLKVFAADLEKSTLVFCPAASYQDKRAIYPPHVELVAVKPSDNGLDLREAMLYLAQSGCNTVLCEGGGRIAAALLEASLVDEVNWFMSPKLLPDSAAINALSTQNLMGLDHAYKLQIKRTMRLGDDLLIQALVEGKHIT